MTDGKRPRALDDTALRQVAGGTGANDGPLYTGEDNPFTPLPGNEGLPVLTANPDAADLATAEMPEGQQPG